ncbi:MAG: VWA domain-containing protein [Myxococcales bacterium]|nr:VWA domain-containing protein [Myxococcales bacterium]
MGYLAPGFALLTALAIVPVLLHLFGKPRAERRRFAALAFLRRSDRKTASQRRLRQIILLVVRAAAIGAVPLILAKPYLEADDTSQAAIGIGSGRAESAVIVLDDSRSMGYRRSGGTLFDAARAQAEKLCDGLGSNSEVAIVLVSGGGPPSLGELTPDRARLRRALREARPTRRPGDVTAALKRAAAILAVAPQAERRVYLLSDLAAHGFSPETGWSGAGPTLVPIDVAEGEALDNRAVVELRVEGAPSLGPRGVRVEAVIASFGALPVKELAVTLRVDGKAVAKGLIDLPARGRTSKRFFHVFEEAAPSPGAAAGEETSAAAPHDVVVELAPDPLGDDDRRFARVQVRRQLRALLVDGDPRTIRRDDEVFYLETALRPGDRDDSRIEVTIVTMEDLGRRPLDDIDVIFLANAKAPDPPRAEALRAFVEKGGGLFLAVGDNVEPEAWNAALGDLLPQPLATARTVGATLKSRDDGEARIGGAGDHIARFDRRHPLLGPFAEGSHGSAEALRSATVGRYLLLKPTPREREGERQVLLRLESGAPLLVEGRHGKGRVLLLATTLDRDWSDLAIQPAYLPLMQQAARHLARTSLAEPDAPSLVGQPREIPLADGDRRVEVSGPGGAMRSFEADRVAGRKSLSFVDTDEPGLYRVSAGGAGAGKPRGQASFAVNVDPPESDLARIEPARLATLMKAREGGTGKTPRRRVELWHALGAALLGLLLVEGVLALRRV